MIVPRRDGLLSAVSTADALRVWACRYVGGAVMMASSFESLQIAAQFCFSFRMSARSSGMSATSSRHSTPTADIRQQKTQCRASCRAWVRPSKFRQLRHSGLSLAWSLWEGVAFVFLPHGGDLAEIIRPTFGCCFPAFCSQRGRWDCSRRSSAR